MASSVGSGRAAAEHCKVLTAGLGTLHAASMSTLCCMLFEYIVMHNDELCSDFQLLVALSAVHLSSVVFKSLH